MPRPFSISSDGPASTQPPYHTKLLRISPSLSPPFTADVIPLTCFHRYGRSADTAVLGHCFILFLRETTDLLAAAGDTVQPYRHALHAFRRN
jgi:hypothetical protein